MKHSSYLFLCICFCLVFAGFIAGCSGKKETKDELLVKETIRKYLLILSEAYRRGEPELFIGIADKKEIRKRDILITNWETTGEYMDSELKSLRFKEVKVSDNTAAVRTRERWTYEYRDIETGEITEEERTIRYDMIYKLIKSGDNWLVAEAQIEKERK